MTQLYPIHTAKTAPAEIKSALNEVREHYGFIPNLMGIMANAPSLLKGYITLTRLLSETRFTPGEQQLMLLTISRQNGCDYCQAAHTTGAARAGLSKDSISAVLNGTELSDPKLEALRHFTATVVETRGLPTDGDLLTFVAAGYDPNQILDVILAVGLKTLSNYTNHIAHTPLDAAFSQAPAEKSA